MSAASQQAEPAPGPELMPLAHIFGAGFAGADERAARAFVPGTASGSTSCARNRSRAQGRPSAAVWLARILARGLEPRAVDFTRQPEKTSAAETLDSRPPQASRWRTG